MYADHYTVPEGLDIKLIGAVRWNTSHSGHWVLSLWRTPDGLAYYSQELYGPWSLPFWSVTRMSDLVQCSAADLEEYVNLLQEQMITDPEELESFRYRSEELFRLWGYAEGTDQAIDDMAKRMRGDD